MLVVNTTNGLITIGAQFVPPNTPGIVPDPAWIAARAKRVAASHGEILLMPGPNEVVASEWAKVVHDESGNATVKAMVDDGILVAKRGVESTRDIKDVPEAVRLIALTGDVALLDKWREGETRKRVLDAIDKQKAVIAEMLKAAELEKTK